MSKSEPRDAVYLNTGQVAEILGITKRTLKNWLKAKWIPEPERNPANRYRRWTLNDVEAIRRILSERNQR
jgi:DNA-binding transcriptional MerR regulator